MNKREPLMHIAKRDSVSMVKAFAIRGLAIVLALIVCGFITTLTTGLNPIAVYGTIIKGAFGSARKTWVTFQNVSVLLIIALAITPAFKMRFWNIGAEGQVLVGCLASAACMITLGGKLPQGTLVVLMLVASVAAGALWAGIPAFFKAKWGTNETLFTLMMNYVATQLVAFFIIIWEMPKGSGTIGIINKDTEAGWILIGNKYLFPIIVAVIATIFLYVYQNYTKHGYELTVVGESVRTARYVGIKVERVIIRTLLLSGALCGIAGFILVAGINHTLTTSLAGGRGFTAVMVSWLANFNPISMIFSSFLLVFLGRGAGEIATEFSLNQSYSDIITGIILFFIIGSEFFVRYRIMLRKKSDKEGVKNA